MSDQTIHYIINYTNQFTKLNYKKKHHIKNQSTIHSLTILRKSTTFISDQTIHYIVNYTKSIFNR